MSTTPVRKCGAQPNNGARPQTGQHDNPNKEMMLNRIRRDRPDEIPETDSRNHARSDRVRVVQQNTGTECDELLFDNRIRQFAAPYAFDTFSEEQVAEMLGVEVRTIQNLTKRSRRLAFVPVGKKRLILRKDLELFLEKQRVRSVDEISSTAGKERSSL